MPALYNAALADDPRNRAMTDQALLSNEFPIPDRMKAWVLGGPGSPTGGGRGAGAR